MTNRTKKFIGIGAVLTVVVAYLAFGFFGIHTRFINTEVNEALPISAAQAEAGVEPIITGSLEGSDRFHSVEGRASVIADGDNLFLRLADFESTNGPDLNVYLRNPNDENDYIDLGDLKGNIGNQNYELPPGTDLSVYTEVDIWCVRFGVTFGGGQLA